MFTDIEGIKTNYLDEGEGEVILLLHGWGTNITFFSGVAEQCRSDYRVVAPDLPGFGETDEPPAPWCVDDYADFILKFCEKLEIKKAVLLGHSFGGRIIIKLLSRKDCPLSCEKVILTGAAGIKPVQSEKAKKKAALYQKGKKFLSTKPMQTLFPNALENLRKKHGSADYLAASPLMRQTLVKTVNEDLSPLLPLIEQEVLLIWGRNDDSTPLSDGERMEKEMKNAGLVVLENAGHFAFMEQQYTFLKIISSFLNIKQ